MSVTVLIASADPHTALGQAGWCGTPSPDRTLVLTVDQEKLLGGPGKRPVRDAAGGIRGQTTGFLWCYQTAREQAPTLQGEMQLVLTLGRTGKPSAARIVADTTKDASFEACVASVALRTRYICNDMGGPNRYRMRLIFEHEPDHAKRRPGARDRDWIHRRPRP